MVAESVLGWMRRARLLPLLGLVLLVAILLAGCGAKAGDDPLLAAKVNGHGITLAQYQQMLAVYRATNDRNNFFSDWRSESQRKDLTTTQNQVFNILTNIELLREQLQQQHITVTQQAIQTARNTLNDQITQSRKQLAQSPDAALKELLDALTPDVIDLLSEQAAMQAVMQEKGKAPAVHMRGIEVKDQQTAQDLEKKAENGSDFGQLAQANSQNKATGAKGGEIGTLFIGQVSEEFDQAVFAPGAHPGKYLILNLQGSYWLFELTDLGPHAVSALGDAQTQSEVITTWLEKVVRPSATIEEYVTID